MDISANATRALPKVSDSGTTRSKGDYLREDEPWSTGNTAHPRHTLLHELFQTQVARTPDVVAVVYERQTLTYVQLNEKANQLARYLMAAGVGPDQRVGICIERSLEMMVALLGTLKAGGAYVPLDPSYPAERLQYMLEDAAPRVLLTQRALIGALPLKAARVIALDSAWSEVAKYDSNNIVEQYIRVGPQNLAYVIYTSGSTGRPKGAMNEHRAVVNRLLWMQDQYHLDGTDRILQKTPVSFDVSVWELFWPLITGACLVLARPGGHHDPRYLRTLIEHNGVTRLHFVPSMLRVFLDQYAAGWCGSIKHVVCSGEELSERLRDSCLERLPGVKLSNLYGPTEAAVDVTFWECLAGDRSSPVPIGRPITNVRIHLLDSNLRPVDSEGIGELYIGGVGVGRGYLNQPGATAERFIADPYCTECGARLYKTGDVGRVRPDGAIEYLGRNDFQVKIRGLRIELGDIEATLAAHKDVKDAAVVLRDEIPGDKRIVAYLVPHPTRLRRSQGRDPNGAAANIVGRWKTLYEETYAKGNTEPSFVGWNSSYTGEPIADEQMREWLRSTALRILQAAPRRVLEIGVGVGLLLEQLAPSCEVYRATDISRGAIEKLRVWTTARAEFRHVQLENCTALDIDVPRQESYDTVILNSVVQYFPDLEYLLEVLERAVEWVSPGGQIFIGDVRHLGTLRAFHSSVQLEKAGAAVSVGTLRENVSRAVRLEKELVVDPRFFERISTRIPSITCTRVCLKRSPYNNELTRYRYDVVLEVRGERESVRWHECEWNPEVKADARLIRKIQENGGRNVRICGVKNVRMCRDVETERLIASVQGEITAGQIRATLGDVRSEGEDPDTFWRIGAELGLDVGVFWTPGTKDGRFDVELRETVDTSSDSAARSAASESTEEPTFDEVDWEAYANDPLGSALRQHLVAEVRHDISRRLPSHMIPSAFVIIDKFPLTPSGKLDRRALPPPESFAHSGEGYEAPQGDVEETLARAWEDLLRVERVGRRANFFELGGHSLLMIELIERMRRLGLATDLGKIYGCATLADMADALTGESTTEMDVPQYLIPEGCCRITPDMVSLVRLDREQIERIEECVPGGAANIQDIYPLAPLQEGMLFHHLLNMHRADAYVLPTLLEVPSREDLDCVLVALQEVVDRHDALRTAVFWERLPTPVQVVHRKAVVPVEELFLTRGADAIEQLKQRMVTERPRLDLRVAPLMRAQIAAEPGGSKWYLLLQLHHMICDNNSLESMLAEVRACAAGGTDVLPTPIPYRDHVARSLARNAAQKSGEFFLSKLKGISAPTAPFGLFNVYRDGSNTANCREELGTALARRVRAHAKRLGVSSATLFHAAWALVVAHTTGRPDIVYGTVMLGRTQGGGAIQRMLGMFINTLPIRLGLDCTASQLVALTHREVTELLNYDQASLAVAQRSSEISGAPSLFSSVLNYRHQIADGDAKLVGSSRFAVVASKSWTNYPIVLSVDDVGDEFLLVVDIDRRIDPRRVIHYTRTAIGSLIAALEQAPETQALELRILPDGERRRILESFNATESPCRDELIHTMFERQVASAPDAIAVVHEARSLTYGQLNARSNQLARYLRAQGVGPDQLVGVYIQRSLEMVVALVAILKAGGAYVPLDPSYPPERLQYMIEDAAPRVLLTQGRVRVELSQTNAKVIDIDACRKEIESHAAGNLSSVGRHSDQLAYALYTSGSTGAPKGVMVAHRGVANILQDMSRELDLGPAACMAAVTTIAFDIAALEIYLPLISGAKIALLSRSVASDGRQLAASLEAHNVTLLQATPSSWQLLLNAGWRGRSQMKALCGGEALTSNLAQDLEAIVGGLWNVYGPTETTIWSSKKYVKGASPDKGNIETIGRPIANTQIYILDSGGRAVPLDVEGELYIGGVGVARGYLNRPGLTAERFVADPFSVRPSGRMYRTGDLGRWRADGTIEYLGRNDRQVKIRGFRVELDEIEAHLVHQRNVIHAVVVVREDIPNDPRLVGYVVPREAGEGGTELNTRILKESLKDALPDYMIPSAFVVLEQLPLTSNGKLDRLALPAPDLGHFVARQYEPPQGEVEERLADIWRGQLGVARIGRHDEFFELGGHSVVAMQIVVRINADLSVELPMSVIFKHPTIEKLAGAVADERDSRLLSEFSKGENDQRQLLANVASMPESEVRALLQSLTMEGTP